MLSKVRRILDDACARRHLPGAVLRVDQHGQTVHLSAHGVTRYDDPTPMTADPWFALASLTKILGTTPAVMLLAQRGAIEVEVGLGAYLPGLHPLLAEIPVYYYLNHTSGLADWRPFYQDLPPNLLGKVEAKDYMRRLLCRETPVAAPGTVERYSDIGMGLIGFMVEAMSGQDLPTFVAERILAPLQIDGLFFGSIATRDDLSIAATENCPWRKHILCGEVQDENAWSAGGCLGQAGMFGTADGVACLLEEYRLTLQGKGRLFTENIMRRFMRRNELSASAGFRYGFDSPSAQGSSTGRYMSPATFGHLGFTGVSTWCDPQRAITIILLTNRVHPTRANEKIRQIRPLVHNAIMEALGT